MAKPLAKPFANYFVPNMSWRYGLEILSTSHIQVFFVVLWLHHIHIYYIFLCTKISFCCCVFVFFVKCSFFEMHKGGARKLRWVSCFGRWVQIVGSCITLWTLLLLLLHSSFQAHLCLSEVLFGAMRRLILLSGFVDSGFFVHDLFD